MALEGVISDCAGATSAVDQPRKSAGAWNVDYRERSPFPEFGLFQGAANVGYSEYNSLGVKLTRRYSAGLTVLGAYTFSKSTDNGSGIRTLGTDPLNPQNSYCLSCEDGPSVFIDAIGS